MADGKKPVPIFSLRVPSEDLVTSDSATEEFNRVSENRPNQEEAPGGDSATYPNGSAGNRALLNRRRGLARRNVVSAHLQPSEQKFVQSIRRKDIGGVVASITNDPHLRTFEDAYGVSALEHAVVSGSTEIVDMLIMQCPTVVEKHQAIERAMLFAIKENNIQLVDHLVDLHRKSGGCRRDSSSQVDTMSHTNCISLMDMKSQINSKPSDENFYEDAEFSQDIKPMVLAAQLERVEIIELLQQKCCPSIHAVTSTKCLYPENCIVCKEREILVGRQSIADCDRAINVYKALSSPAYMFHADVNDPILEAFIISDTMEKRMVVDPAYREEYEMIGQKCRSFATTLLKLCRGDEAKTLLSVTNGIELTHRVKYHQAHFPRLLLAIHFNQKEFIALPHCQQIMQNEWYKGLPKWVCSVRLHQMRLLLYTLAMFFLFPFIFLLYLFRIPFIERFVKPPINKFILDTCSFTYFLIMLFIRIGLRLQPARGGAMSGLDYVLFVWVVGLTVRYAKMTLRRRDSCGLYLNNPENSNWYFFELIMLILFWMQYLLLFGLMMHAAVTRNLQVDRLLLPMGDPLLVAEVCGACASTMTVVQVYSFFKVSSILGPLQVSLKKMIVDVICFILLFIVVLSAFAIGLCSLYSGYNGLSVTDPETNETVFQPKEFTSLQETFKRLFWDLFGYGDEENADLLNGNTGAYVIRDSLSGTNGTNGTLHVIHTTVLTSHRLTEVVGYIMYGAYHITVIIVLLNMLIAMMANSYNNIEANADTEWKFARTHLFMNYMNEIGVLSPPFNLLPVRSLLALLGGRFAACHVFMKPEKEKLQNDPQALMDRLRKRYWKMRGVCHDTALPGQTRHRSRSRSPCRGDVQQTTREMSLTDAGDRGSMCV